MVHRVRQAWHWAGLMVAVGLLVAVCHAVVVVPVAAGPLACMAVVAVLGMVAAQAWGMGGTQAVQGKQVAVQGKLLVGVAVQGIELAAVRQGVSGLGNLNGTVHIVHEQVPAWVVAWVVPHQAAAHVAVVGWWRVELMLRVGVFVEVWRLLQR